MTPLISYPPVSSLITHHSSLISSAVTNLSSLVTYRLDLVAQSPPAAPHRPARRRAARSREAGPPCTPRPASRRWQAAVGALSESFRVCSRLQGSLPRRVGPEASGPSGRRHCTAPCRVKRRLPGLDSNKTGPGPGQAGPAESPEAVSGSGHATRLVPAGRHESPRLRRAGPAGAQPGRPCWSTAGAARTRGRARGRKPVRDEANRGSSSRSESDDTTPLFILSLPPPSPRATSPPSLSPTLNNL